MADGDAPPPGVPGCGPAKLGILVLDDKNCGTIISAIITKVAAVNGGITGSILLVILLIISGMVGGSVSHVSNLSQGVQHGNLVYRQHAIKAWAPGHDTSPEILPVSVQ